MLSETQDPNEVIDALVAGASGYLAKDDSIETVVGGIVRLRTSSSRGESLV